MQHTSASFEFQSHRDLRHELYQGDSILQVATDPSQLVSRYQQANSYTHVFSIGMNPR